MVRAVDSRSRLVAIIEFLSTRAIIESRVESVAILSWTNWQTLTGFPAVRPHHAGFLTRGCGWRSDV